MEFPRFAERVAFAARTELADETLSVAAGNAEVAGVMVSPW
jgi:hypothetical protein